ncbi:MAG: Uma2 family endonuclease [Spirulinaceae cyanobacterium]
MIASPQRLSPAEYLALEAQSPVKHEYIRGRVLAMAGTTDTHNVISGNLFVALRSQLRGTACQVYFADIKVRLEQCDCYYYPDLLVTCDADDQNTTTYKRYPKLIVEVLSASTEAFDRGDKFQDYQTSTSLAEYVLVNTKRRQVEVFRRMEGGLWLLQTYLPPDKIELRAVGLQISFDELYADVVLSQTAQAEGSSEA